VKIEFHPQALEEMFESARYYKSRSVGLGEDFLEAVEETTRRIEQFPNAGPVATKDIRKRLVFGFPFSVLYNQHEQTIYVVAVMHQRRRPGYWKSRL